MIIFEVIIMWLLYTILGILTFIVAIVFLTAYICFVRIFLSKRYLKKNEDDIELPQGAIYEEYYGDMIKWARMTQNMPHTKVSITSFDGLTLRGKYYEYKKGAPIEILFHGYRGSAERDMSGAVLRCAELGRSALLVDHRASGKSDGKVISFGVNESRDCITWIDYVIKHIDKDAKIILTGISMGAATVMSLADTELPKNVVGILADCGYTTTSAIIKKVMKDMKLPPKMLMPFVRLGAKVFGGFKVDKVSPLEALRNSKLPVIFIHGDADDYVPYEMSVENYNACISTKRLVRIEGAGHGIAFLKAPEKYYRELREFFEPLLSEEKPIALDKTRNL